MKECRHAQAATRRIGRRRANSCCVHRDGLGLWLGLLWLFFSALLRLHSTALLWVLLRAATLLWCASIWMACGIGRPQMGLGPLVVGGPQRTAWHERTTPPR